jgi:two-component system, sensor histidine kinase and response regulator
MDGDHAQDNDQPAATLFPALTSTDWRQRLARIPGLDVERGLTAMRGHAPQYARVLALFADSHEHDPDRLAAGLATRDRVALRELLHCLRGSAASIGATQVAATATAFHAAVRSGDETAEFTTLGTTLIGQLKEFIAAIRRAIG